MTPTEIKGERSSSTLIIIFLTAALFGLNECTYQIRVGSYEDCKNHNIRAGEEWLTFEKSCSNKPEP